MSKGKVVNSYNRYRNLDTIVGYDVKIDNETAKSLGIYTSDNENAVQALIRVEKTSRTKSFPVSISNGFISYPTPQYHFSILTEDPVEKGVLCFSEVSKDDSIYYEVEYLGVEAVEEYEEEYGEYLDVRRTGLSFVPIVSPKEQEPEYEEEPEEELE